MKILTHMCVFLLILTSCQNQNKIKEIRLGHGLDTKHSVHLAMVHMGHILDSLSQGKIKLKVYPNSQLGSERECIELLQMGSLDMTKVSAGVLENFSPKMKIFGLPYLFNNREHTYKVLDSQIGIGLLADLENYWLKGMCYYDAGSRSFYTKQKAIGRPEDLSGQKIRVMESVTAMEMVKSMGGSPTPIASGELYTALQQGVVDGAENNPPTFYSSKHYEVCKYYTINEHTTIPDVLVSSTALWDTLTEQEKDWLLVATKKSVQFQRKLWVASEEKALAEVERAGVTITYPSKEAFKKTTKALRAQYVEDPAMSNLIEKIQNFK